jgi:ComF family protein
MLVDLRRGLLSLVVPPLCAGCREPELSGDAVCPDCRSRLVALPVPRCSRCGAPTTYPRARCRECRDRRLVFARAWSPFAYEGVCRGLVGALKSRAALPVAELMAAALAARAPAELLIGPLVPVPAHSGRRRRHGFNQSAAIAAALGRRAGLPVRDVLRRAGRVAPQVGLERRARIANARGSVEIKPRVAPPREAVLVDDVYTTGATLDACAKALVAAGAEQVVALTFARAVRG